MSLSNYAFTDIISCKGKDGKTVYTDNESKCASLIKKIALHVKKDTRVNYRFPERNYLNFDGNYSIKIEFPESGIDKVNLNSAAKRLELALDYIFEKIPKNSHEYLRSIDFYIMIGPGSKFGGETNGLRYYPRIPYDPLLLGDPNWSHTVVIYSVSNFLSLSDLWVNKATMHELSHAWHYKEWDLNYPKLHEVWIGSRQKSLYLSQKDTNGVVLSPAYASKNEKEYFSEISAIYFVGGDYYPFSRGGLKKYDPSGYALVERLWGLR